MPTVNDSANSSSEGPATHRRLSPRTPNVALKTGMPEVRFITFASTECCMACPGSITTPSAAKVLMGRGRFGYLCPACLASDDAALRARIVRHISHWRDEEAKERARDGTADPVYASMAADLITLTTAGFTIHRDGIGPWLDQLDVCANPTVRAAVEAAVLGQAVQS